MWKPRAAPDGEKVEIKTPITASTDSTTSRDLMIAAELLELAQVQGEVEGDTEEQLSEDGAGPRWSLHILSFVVPPLIPVNQAAVSSPNPALCSFCRVC